ncbi:MAG: pilus assembly protein TadE [Frankiales bacterium]|jgi:Flp pilus assembly protein TadG|nr:pilus assembly protein TadE [Frankiales bacterium]
MARAARPTGSAGDEAGAAVVEFVGVLFLLLTLFLVVLQVGLTLHVRNVLIASAAEGARYAANADRTDAEGAERAREAAASALSGQLAARLRVAAEPDPTGPGVVQVTITAPVPLVVPLVSPFSLTVHGHALEEASP